MKIDFENSKIILIDDKSELKSPHQSQLFFWGFVKTSGTQFISDEDSDGAFLEKVFGYLQKYFNGIEVLGGAKDKLKKLAEEKNILLGVFTSAKDYKNGVFNHSEFNNFCLFLDKKITRKLRDHQIKSAYHLFLLKNGANFSVPGSGKTSVVLAVYEKLKSEGLVNTLFVIGPPSCFGPWRFEFLQTLGREPDYRILAGGKRVERTNEYFKLANDLGELYLTSFQTLLNDQKYVRSFLENNGIKAFLVVDEAHYIKQINGEYARAVLSLSVYAKFRCILTGTPIPKSFTDVFNMFDFLYPSYPPIEEHSKTQIEYFEKQKMMGDAKKLLDNRIGPLFYRVRKIDLGLMSPNFHAPILVKMNKYEELLYQAIIKKIRNYSKEDYIKNIDLVERLTRGRIIRLRQCISYSKLMTTAIDGYDEDLLLDEKDLSYVIANYDRLEKPAKLIELIKMISNFQQTRKKVVVWSNFRETLKLIKRELHKNGYKSEMIYGDTPTQVTSLSVEKTREQIRDEFVDENSGLDILIANPAACAESISLHKTCFHAIYYDLSYNCAQYLQSLDRVHRVGGSETNQANYYFLQYENSIDQDILNNVRQKAQRMNDIIEKDYEIYSLDMFAEDDEIAAYQRLFGSKSNEDA